MKRRKERFRRTERDPRNDTMSLTVFLGYAVVAAACAYLFKVVY